MEVKYEYGIAIDRVVIEAAKYRVYFSDKGTVITASFYSDPDFSRSDVFSVTDMNNLIKALELRPLSEMTPDEISEASQSVAVFSEEILSREKVMIINCQALVRSIDFSVTDEGDLLKVVWEVTERCPS